MAELPKSFFIAVQHKDDDWRGFSIAYSEDRISRAANPERREPQKPEIAPPDDVKNFQDVFFSFRASIQIYLSFLAFMVTFAPMASSAMAYRTIDEFAKTRGQRRDDLSDEARVVYELNFDTHRAFVIHKEKIDAGLRGAKHLPEVMLIGLISTYDAFLGNLLRVAFDVQPQIILTSEKAIKFSDLAQYDSIEAARNSIIDHEIEALLRSSHQEHFQWMEKKFGVQLRKLPAFADFIEVCERRNLITHTGGVVSRQYIANCKEHGIDVQSVAVGDRLFVDQSYYQRAVETVCEIGIKLCYVLWRRLIKGEQDKADSLLNEFGFDLVTSRNYKLAEAILSFGVDKAKADSCRRMMIINQANAVRLQKREGEAGKILDAHDWSAVSNEYKISVAAVRGDVDEVVRLMRRGGADGYPGCEDYRSWPVFRGLRTKTKIVEAFQEVFGEPIIAPKVEDLPDPTGSAESVSAPGKILHQSS